MSGWYVYLNQEWFADAWVSGGPIPINPAAQYLGSETAGTSTPDEVTQRDVHYIDPALYNELCEAGFAGGPHGNYLNGCTVIRKDGTQTVVTGWARIWADETIILSFSKLCELRLQRALSHPVPKKAIVRILDPQRLLDHVSGVLGVQGYASHFNYTRSASRSHDLKGWADRHMAEIRLYWPMSPAEKREVILPPGIGERVDLATVPEVDCLASSLDFEAYDRAFGLGGADYEPAPPKPISHKPQIFDGVEFRGKNIVLDLRDPQPSTRGAGTQS